MRVHYVNGCHHISASAIGLMRMVFRHKFFVHKFDDGIFGVLENKQILRYSNLGTSTSLCKLRTLSLIISMLSIACS